MTVPSVTQKCERLAQAIADELQLRIPIVGTSNDYAVADFVITKSYDADSNVYLTVTPKTGISHFILIRPEDAIPSLPVYATDGLGLPQRVYVPNIIRLGLDTTYAIGASPVALTLIAVCVLKGCKTEFYQSATIAESDVRTGPSNGNFVVAFGDMQWGVLSQQ